MTDAQLKSEITADPAGVGYAGKSPTVQSDLINSRTGPGSGTIAKAVVNNTDPGMRAMLAHAWLQVRTSSDPVLKQDYLTLITLIGQLGSIVPGDQRTQAVVSQAIADHVVTPELVAAAITRIGSRAEVLWGDGATVSWQDIARAISS